MAEETVRVGVIGCGGFGLFALQHFTQVPAVKLVGMAGTHRPAAYAAAERYGVPDIVDVDRLVAQDDIDVIYIATPPFLHHPQALAALAAGKHVICEKPLALTLDQADDMIAAAKKHNVFVVANLMQRYNRIYDAVDRLIRERILGELLHAYFENYATDENLAPDHWFWDRSKSGGIFIEHGVHFFDMFAGWLGPGTVVAAQKTLRPGTAIEEQVHCTVQYGETVLVNFYHGFHQPARMDRQEMRFVFEHGNVTCHEWIPTRVNIHAIADEHTTRKLCDLFPQSTLDVQTPYPAKERTGQSRHKPFNVYQMLDLTHGAGEFKWTRYGELLRALFADQIAWVRNRRHPRKITETNARDSLAMAVAADQLAHT